MLLLIEFVVQRWNGSTNEKQYTHTANLQSPQTRIEMLLRSLTPTQRKAVEAEVKRLLKLKELDQANSNPWLKRLMK